MPRHAGLAADCRVMADLRAAGDADQGDQQSMFSNACPVTNRDQIADLGPGADHRFSERGPLNRDVGADLDVVVQFDDPHLGDFVMNAAVRCVTKSILADHSAGMEDHAIVENAIVIHHRVWIENAIGSQ